MSDIDWKSILPEGWPRPRGYSHGVLSSGQRSLHVAGQIGTQPGEHKVAHGAGFGSQFALALANVVAVVRAAGGEAGNIVALRAYLTNVDDFGSHGAAIGAAWAESLGRHFPAMTIVQVPRLLDTEAVVEIEAEARLP